MSQPETNPLAPETAVRKPAEASTTEEQVSTPHAVDEKKILSNLSASSSTTATPADKEQRPKSSSSNNAASDNEVDALIAHLPEDERQVLKTQLEEIKVNISFFGLWRYATKIDILIMIISAICAIAAGAALPLFTVRICPCGFSGACG
jgi:ATP-binding cassette subfamily B (MDR/TAP) protein 1